MPMTDGFRPRNWQEPGYSFPIAEAYMLDLKPPTLWSNTRPASRWLRPMQRRIWRNTSLAESRRYVHADAWRIRVRGRVRC